MHKRFSAMDKELKDMTVREVIMQPGFVRYLDEVIKGEASNHRTAELQALVTGRRLQRTAYDSLTERKVMEGARMVDLYGAVLDKSLVGFSAEERRYIEMIGNEAYRRYFVRLHDDEERKNKK